MKPELSPELLAQLEQLRDIRLPDAVSWWPLAPGWWMVLALACFAIFAALVWNVVRKYTTSYQALRELEQFSANDPVEYATGVSVLLRRVAMRKDAAIGQLKDGSWADFLTVKGMEPALANHLAVAPYAAEFSDAPRNDVLRHAAATWIRRQA